MRERSKRVRIRGRFEDAVLLALKTRSQGAQVPLGAGEGKGSDSSLEPLEGAQPCPHFDISQDPLQVALGD